MDATRISPLKELQRSLDVFQAPYSEASDQENPLSTILELYQLCASNYFTLNRDEQEEFANLSNRLRSLSDTSKLGVKIKSVVGHFFGIQDQASFSPIWISDKQIQSSPFLRGLTQHTEDLAATSNSLTIEINCNELNIKQDDPHLQKVLEFLRGAYQPSEKEPTRDLLALLSLASYFGIKELQTSIATLLEIKLPLVNSEEANDWLKENPKSKEVLHYLLKDLEDHEIDSTLALLLYVSCICESPSHVGKLFSVYFSTHTKEESLFCYKLLVASIHSPLSIQLSSSQFKTYLAFEALLGNLPSPSTSLSSESIEDLQQIPFINRSRITSLTLTPSSSDNLSSFSLANLLATTPNLEYLDLSLVEKIEGSWPQDLPLNLSRLHTVSFPKNLQTSTLVNLLIDAPNIEHLDLSSVKEIEGGNWRLIAQQKLDKLKTISFPKKLDSSIFAYLLIAAFPYTQHVSQLDLSSIEHLASFWPDHVQLSFHNLQALSFPKKLDLSSLVNLLTGSFQFVQNMTHLNLSSIRELYGYWPTDSIQLNFPMLQTISFPQRLTAHALVSICLRTPDVSHLDFSSTIELQEAWPAHIRLTLSNLQSISFPKKTNPLDADKLLTLSPNLNHVDLSASEETDETMISHVQKCLSLPNLKTISLPKLTESSSLAASILEQADWAFKDPQTLIRIGNFS